MAAAGAHEEVGRGDSLGIADRGEKRTFGDAGDDDGVGLIPHARIFGRVGVAVVEFVGGKLPESSFFRSPSVDLQVAIYATLLLIAAGTAAGFFPARKAARIRPIEALRDE